MKKIIIFLLVFLPSVTLAGRDYDREVIIYRNDYRNERCLEEIGQSRILRACDSGQNTKVQNDSSSTDRIIYRDNKGDLVSTGGNNIYVVLGLLVLVFGLNIYIKKYRKSSYSTFSS